MENLKVTLGWLTVNVENALERKWNVVSNRWKCVNFPSTLELESLWVVMFQNQKNSEEKQYDYHQGRRKRKGSHCYESLIPKRKAFPQRRGAWPPSFLFSSDILCPQWAVFTLLSSNFPSSLPVSSYPLQFLGCFLSLLMLHTSYIPPSLLSMLSTSTSPQRGYDAALGPEGANFSPGSGHCESSPLTMTSIYFRWEVAPNHAWW